MKLSKVTGALAQAAATRSLAAMHPNPDADLTDNSIMRMRSCLEPRKGPPPKFLKTAAGKQKLSVKAEMAEAAQAEQRTATACASRSAAAAEREEPAVVEALAKQRPVVNSAHTASAAPLRAEERPRRARRMPAAYEEFV